MLQDDIILPQVHGTNNMPFQHIIMDDLIGTEVTPRRKKQQMEFDFSDPIELIDHWNLVTNTLTFTHAILTIDGVPYEQEFPTFSSTLRSATSQ